RQIESGANQRSFLVASSPDAKWIAYYQRSTEGPPDRFIVDTWVLDPTSDERIKLIDASSPLGWVADGSGLVLGERPSFMVTVPGGELVPAEGQLLVADSLRATTSPDGRFRAGVSTTPNGAAGVNVFDLASGEMIMSVPTGRGAVQLAWSPDSNRLAY